ncbi:MAG TPA: aldo/keto reductase [Pyrinomonadaceae bacterium]|nr:aldo/keto reductase [Pyrinomonadaceae bacterium]
MLTGHATSAGSARYAARFDKCAEHFRKSQQLVLSSIGIGTYLGNADDQTDRAYESAIRRSVHLGSNVIDTAANYRFQRSERAIGNALRELVENNGFSRDELVICTKGGYLPFDGAPPADVRAYVEETFVKPGIARFDDFVAGSHCMTPAYLQNQLDQSLRNMQVDSVDVYYIHNPESQLGHVSETEFYTRLRAAFALLEENRSRGKLSFYGVATWNGFRAAEGSAGYHSLEKMATLATEVAGKDHGFRFVQLPFNLGMTEAFTLLNQTVGGRKFSALEAAGELGITAVSSASILQGRVAHGLPSDLQTALGSLSSDAQTAIQFVRSTPGVTTALIGMSNVEHVDENLQLVNVAPVSRERFVGLFDES